MTTEWEDCQDEADSMITECYFPWRDTPGGAVTTDICHHCGPSGFANNFIERLGYFCTVEEMKTTDPRNMNFRVCVDDVGSGGLGILTAPGFPIRFITRAAALHTKRVTPIEPAGGWNGETIQFQVDGYTAMSTAPNTITPGTTNNQIVLWLIDSFYNLIASPPSEYIDAIVDPDNDGRLLMIHQELGETFTMFNLSIPVTAALLETIPGSEIKEFDAFGETVEDLGFGYFFGNNGQNGKILYLLKNTTMQFLPCQDYYMATSPPEILNRTHLCRVLLLGGSPQRHVLRCIRTDMDLDTIWLTTDPPPSPIPEQRLWKNIDINLNTRNEPMHWLLTSDPAVTCHPLRDAYCFSDSLACEDDDVFNEDRVWTCIGPPVGAVNLLNVDFAGRHSPSQYKYPNANAGTKSLSDADWWNDKGDVWLRNMIFVNAGELMPLQLVHDSNQLYNSHSLNEWLSSGWEAGTTENDRIVKYYLGGSTFGSYIPINRLHLRSRAVFPMQLVLNNQNTSWYCSLLKSPNGRPNEFPNAGQEIRLTGVCHVIINVKVKLLPEAYTVNWPFQFMNPADPYDLRIEDPADPGVEITTEDFVNYGPNNEHINLIQRWIGMSIPYPWGEEYFGGQHQQCNYTSMNFQMRGWQNKERFVRSLDATLPEWEMRFAGDITTGVP